MKVKELINILQKIEDKNSDVRIETERDMEDKYLENQWLRSVNVETLDTSCCDMPDYPNTCQEIVLSDYERKENES